MRRARTATAFVLLLGTGCGTAATAGLPGDGLADAPATVEVRNQHWADVRVYALAGAARHRLGTVASMTTSRLELPAFALGGRGEIRFFLDPVGGGEGHVTQPLTVWAGQTVDLTVHNQLGLTVASIR